MASPKPLLQADSTEGVATTKCASVQEHFATNDAERHRRGRKTDTTIGTAGKQWTAFVDVFTDAGIYALLKRVPQILAGRLETKLVTLTSMRPA